jgi:hypothetical protein
VEAKKIKTSDLEELRKILPDMQKTEDIPSLREICSRFIASHDMLKTSSHILPSELFDAVSLIQVILIFSKLIFRKNKIS